MRHEESPLSIIIKRTIGFVIFIILLLVANTLLSGINNAIYNNIIGFFDVNISLFLSLFFWGMASEILWNLYFPWNLFGPIASAILSVSVVTFFYKIWLFIGGYVNVNANISIFMIPIYILVFIIVLVSGYARLAFRGMANEKYNDDKWKEWRKDRIEMHRKIKEIKRNRNKVEWEDVGEEFKYALYNLGNSLNRAFEKYKKEDKRRKRRK